MTEIMSAPFSFGKMPLTIMTESRKTNEICQIMDTQIIGWKRGGYHRFTKEGYGKQRCWIRGDADGGNNEGGEGFIDLSEAEQMALPFN